jgi:hypothetical protein
MKKKDPARACRKFPLHLKGSHNRQKERGFYEDTTEDLGRALLLTGRDRNIQREGEI